MTVIWLIVWLFQSTPPVGDWNSWMIALVICAGLDVLWTLDRRRKR